MQSISRRHVRLTVMGLGALGVLLVVPQVSEAQRRGGGGMRGSGSGGGGGVGDGGGARASTDGARMSGNGGHRAPGGEGAAHTSVNRDFNNAQLIETATTSTTSRSLDNYDLDYDVDSHWHPVARAAAWTVGATAMATVVGSIAYALPPSCTATQVATPSYYQCGPVWYQPQFAGTTVTYVVIESPR